VGFPLIAVSIGRSFDFGVALFILFNVLLIYFSLKNIHASMQEGIGAVGFALGAYLPSHKPGVYLALSLSIPDSLRPILQLG